MPTSKKRSTMEYDWDPQKFVLVRNKSGQHILLDLPTGSFRLDAGRSFRMTPDIVDVRQVKDLVATGQIEIGKK